MSTKAPSALYGMYKLLDPYLSSLKIGGVVGDTRHVAGGGYHISREDLRSHGQGRDYSIQAPADLRGPADCAAAIDLTLSREQMVLVSKRLKAAMTTPTPGLSGGYDPRIEPLREFIGTVDNRNVCGYNRYRTGRGTGWYASGYSEVSHLWHVHLSLFRAYCNDVNAVRGVAEVVAGLKPGVLGWHDPDQPAKAPAPAPVKVPAPAPVTPTPTPTEPQEDPVPKTVISIDAPGSGNWQGVVRDIEADQWFLAEAQVIDGEDREDTVLHRFNAAGKYLDSMRCSPAKGYKLHATSFGVNDGNVWLTWNEDANDVVTVRYVPGATVRKADCQLMHVFSDGNIQIGFSPDRKDVVLRRVRAEVDEFRHYAKQDVLDGTDNQQGKTLIIPRETDKRTMQGFGIIEDRLYILTGRPSRKQPTIIERWSFTTGKLIDKTTIDLPGEAEGIDGLTYGRKVGTGAARRLVVNRHGL